MDITMESLSKERYFVFVSVQANMTMVTSFKSNNYT